MKYLCKIDETPDVKIITDEIRLFIKTAEERHQFLQKQMDTINDERGTVWNKLWEHLKASGMIKPGLTRDQWSLSFCDDLEQVFMQKIPNGNPFSEFFK